MKQLLQGVWIFVLLVWCAPVAAQDAAIEDALSKVSADRIKAGVYKLVSFGTRHTGSLEDDPVRGIGAARRWIAAEMKKSIGTSSGRLTVEEDWFEAGNRRLPKQRMANVVAILPGSDGSKRAYVVGGHYDSRVSDATNATADAPGAVDDASGTAIAMELLRVMAPLKLKATVIFVAFVGEEQGLFGSTHLAERLKNEGWQIDGMIGIDIAGNSEGGSGLRNNTTVRIFSEGIADGDSTSREWARYVDHIARRYVPDGNVEMVYRRDRYGRGGDHTPFHRQGFPAVRMSEFFENYNHQHQDIREENGIQYGDLPEFLDYDYAARNARIAGAALMNAAMGSPPPKSVTIRGAVSYDTAVHWEAAEGAVRYEIVYRRTSAPQWEKSVSVGSGTSFVLKNVVMDNFIFGVRSVDADGHESRVQPAQLARRRRPPRQRRPGGNP